MDNDEQQTSSDPTADELMRRVSNGHRQSFELLYPRLARRIFPFLVRMVGRSRGEELFQEVVLKLWELRGQYKPGTSLFGWAYAIARNKARDDGRRKRRYDRVFHPSTAVDPPSRAPSAVERLASRRAIEALVATVGSLPSDQAEAFELVHFEGLTYAEVARLMDRSPSAIKALLHRALESTRQRMSDELA